MAALAPLEDLLKRMLYRRLEDRQCLRILDYAPAPGRRLAAAHTCIETPRIYLTGVSGDCIFHHLLLIKEN